MDFATGPIGHKKHIENLVEMGGDFCLQDAEIKLKQDLAAATIERQELLVSPVSVWPGCPDAA